jgi:hypothetical protein
MGIAVERPDVGIVVLGQQLRKIHHVVPQHFFRVGTEEFLID